MRIISYTDESDASAYPFLSAVVIPRPIAWISTCSAEGTGNLAPHSFFTVACVEPPIVAFSSVGRKDTLRNLEEVREFVVNFSTVELMELINASSAEFGPDIDEAAALGIAMEDSQAVQPRRVRDSPVAMECKVTSIQPLGDSTLVLGAVQVIAVDDSVLDTKGRIDASALQGVSRLARDQWGMPPQPVTLQRPHLAGSQA